MSRQRAERLPHRVKELAIHLVSAWKTFAFIQDAAVVEHATAVVSKTIGNVDIGVEQLHRLELLKVVLVVILFLVDIIAALILVITFHTVTVVLTVAIVVVVVIIVVFVVVIVAVVIIRILFAIRVGGGLQSPGTVLPHARLTFKQGLYIHISLLSELGADYTHQVLCYLTLLHHSNKDVVVFGKHILGVQTPRVETYNVSRRVSFPKNVWRGGGMFQGQRYQ